MKLYIMCGLPDSGKTTKAAALAEETGATVISHDAYYKTVIRPSDVVTREMLERVTENALADVKTHLENGEDVIYDAVNHTVESRKNVLEKCAVEGLHTVCLYLDTPLEQCEARNRMWARTFQRSLEVPTESEGFDELIISMDGRNQE